MPRYTFQVENGKTVCEMAGVELPDNDTARAYAIQFVAELFRSRNELYAAEWHLCSIHVLNDEETELFATTVREAALAEREQLRISQRVNH
jgi:hypothetical protein